MNKALLSSKRMNWMTPPEVFGPLNEEFSFFLDLAASRGSEKCDLYFSPESDSLAQDWTASLEGNWGWLNCPYGRELGKWIAKAAGERQRGASVVMLIPARPDTKAWHNYILGQPGVEVRFLKGRIKFIDPDTGKPGNPAPFPSAVVIFRGAK